MGHHKRTTYPPPSYRRPSHAAVIGALIAALMTVIADTNTLVEDTTSTLFHDGISGWDL